MCFFTAEAKGSMDSMQLKPIEKAKIDCAEKLFNDVSSSNAGKLKSIGVYGLDCKKLYEIHVDHKHDGLNIHFHPWENGHPEKTGTGKNAKNKAFL